jgi:hypothetical protein
MLNVDLAVRLWKFGHKIIDAVSKEFRVSVNNIFSGALEKNITFPSRIWMG